jgi:hypothetical protein
LQADLGMARRAGLLDAGFEKVLAALDKKVSPRLLFEAAGPPADGGRKLAAAIRSRELAVEIVATLTRDELSLALGRENVVHAAVRPGALADRLLLNAKRLAGLRSEPTDTTGPSPGQNESTL